MKRFLLLLPALLASLAAFAQYSTVGNGSYATKTVYLKQAVGKIIARQGVEVCYTDTSRARPKVTAEVPEAYLKYLRVEQKGRELTIGFYDENGNDIALPEVGTVRVQAAGVTDFCAMRRAVLTIDGDIRSAANLNIDAQAEGIVRFGRLWCADITVVSSHAAGVEGRSLSCGKLTISCADGSEVALESVACGSIDATGSGEATVTLAGKCKDAGRFNFSGSAVLFADRLVVPKAEAAVGSGGRMHINVRELDVKEHEGGQIINNSTQKR